MDRNAARSIASISRAASPPARVAWIETINLYIVVVTSAVATREGGVDRNWLSARTFGFGSPVATREGGVDRNFELFPRDAGGAAVATREGGVDRNSVDHERAEVAV